jgi:hypothetical protein
MVNKWVTMVDRPKPCRRLDATYIAERNELISAAFIGAEVGLEEEG